MKDKQEGLAAADGGASAVAGVVSAVGHSEAGRLAGWYTAKCVGPRESERAAYVAARDDLEAARHELGFRRRVVAEARRLAPRGLRKGLVTLLAAVGLLAGAQPALARAYGDLATAQQRVAVAERAVGRFVLEDKWDAGRFPNLVTTVGGNLGLDTILAGSSYSVVGPYLGLINTNASASAIGDTMSSHAGWLEVGNANAPAYTAPRKTVAFSAASAKSKAASSASSFAITSGGTVGGCFLVLGTGALSTIDNTAGTLYSAGAFTGGSKVVANGDTLNVTYTATI